MAKRSEYAHLAVEVMKSQIRKECPCLDPSAVYKVMTELEQETGIEYGDLVELHIGVLEELVADLKKDLAAMEHIEYME